jgi:hypothetical protein
MEAPSEHFQCDTDICIPPEILEEWGPLENSTSSDEEELLADQYGGGKKVSFLLMLLSLLINCFVIYSSKFSSF